MLDSLGVRKVDFAMAYFLLRVALGFNMTMHGAARLISGNAAFAAGLVHTFQASLLPQSAVLAFGLSLPWVEVVIGLLLLSGCFTRWTLLAGSGMMLILTFGSALHQDWNITAIQLNYSVVYAVLLAFNGVDRYSLDKLLNRESLCNFPAQCQE